jgi:hypothetical protein
MRMLVRVLNNGGSTLVRENLTARYKDQLDIFRKRWRYLIMGVP